MLAEGRLEVFRGDVQIALVDERAGNGGQPRIRSPIAWDGVTFVPGTHLGITHHSVTVDSILHLLLERPLD